MFPTGRRKKTASKERRRNREITGAAYQAMLPEIVQRIKVFKKMGGAKPCCTMRDLKKESGQVDTV